MGDKTYGQTSSSALTTSNAYASYLMYRTWGLPPGHHQCQLGGGAGRLFRRQQLLDDEPHPVEQERRQGHAQTDLHLQCQAGLQPAQKPSSEHQRRLFALPHRGHRVQQPKTYKGYQTLTNSKGVNGSVLNTNRTDWMNENMLTYKKDWKNGRHKLQRRGRIHDAGQQPAALRLFEHADPQRVARHQRHRRRSARLDDGAADGELPHVVARTHQLQLPVALHVHRFVPRRRIVEILSPTTAGAISPREPSHGVWARRSSCAACASSTTPNCASATVSPATTASATTRCTRR